MVSHVPAAASGSSTEAGEVAESTVLTLGVGWDARSPFGRVWHQIKQCKMDPAAAERIVTGWLGTT